jgi:hypothetical protein
MEIKADGVYMPVMLRRFKLYKSYLDFVCFPRIIEVFCFIRVSINECKIIPKTYFHFT